MSKLPKVLSRVLFVMARLVGIVPFGYSFKARVASTSLFWRFYTAVVTITLVASTPPVMSTISSRVAFLQQRPLLSFVGCNRFLVLFLCAISTSFIQLLNSHSITYCCNEGIRIFKKLSNVDADKIALDKSTIIQLLIKTATLWSITQMTIFYIIHDGALENASLFASLVCTYYCQLVLIMTLNTFYAATLLLAAFMRQLNQSLARTFTEIRSLSRHPSRMDSLKMQRYCEFADRLEKIFKLRRDIASLEKSINHLYQVQIVGFLLYASIEPVVQSYFLYFVHTHIDKSIVGNVSIGAVTYVVSWLVDLVLIINAVERMVRQSAETKFIVRVAAQVGRVDERLERTMEEFAAYLGTEEVTVSACGLFKVDHRCLFMMGQNLLTSMVILIQFDQIQDSHK